MRKSDFVLLNEKKSSSKLLMKLENVDYLEIRCIIWVDGVILQLALNCLQQCTRNFFLNESIYTLHTIMNNGT